MSFLILNLAYYYVPFRKQLLQAYRYNNWIQNYCTVTEELGLSKVLILAISLKEVTVKKLGKHFHFLLYKE